MLASTELFYSGTGLSDRGAKELASTARFGWAELAPKLHLLEMPHPLLLLVAATGVGGLIGFLCSWAKTRLRMDPENLARSSIAWGLHGWRRPRTALWLAAFAVLSMLCLTMVDVFPAPVPHASGALVLTMAFLLAVCFFLLAVHPNTVGDEPSFRPLLSGLELWRVTTWAGLLVSLSGIGVATALIGIPYPLAELLDFFLFALGLQLLVRRQERPMPWGQLVSWRALGSFLTQYFYLVLAIAVVLGPLCAFVLFNIFLVPAIYQIFAMDGAPVPQAFRLVVNISSFCVQYWWLFLPWLVLPIMWLMSARLAWQLSRQAASQSGHADF